MKARLGLIGLFALAWTLILLGNYVSGWFWVAYLAVGVLYIIIVEGPIFLLSFALVILGVGWPCMVLIALMFYSTERHRNTSFRDLLSITRSQAPSVE